VVDIVNARSRTRLAIFGVERFCEHSAFRREYKLAPARTNIGTYDGSRARLPYHSRQFYRRIDKRSTDEEEQDHKAPEHRHEEDSKDEVGKQAAGKNKQQQESTELGPRLTSSKIDETVSQLEKQQNKSAHLAEIYNNTTSLACIAAAPTPKLLSLISQTCLTLTITSMETMQRSNVSRHIWPARRNQRNVQRSNPSYLHQGGHQPRITCIIRTKFSVYIVAIARPINQLLPSESSPVPYALRDEYESNKEKQVRTKEKGNEMDGKDDNKKKDDTTSQRKRRSKKRSMSR